MSADTVRVFFCGYGRLRGFCGKSLQRSLLGHAYLAGVPALAPYFDCAEGVEGELFDRRVGVAVILGSPKFSQLAQPLELVRGSLSDRSYPFARTSVRVDCGAS